jgi:O-antigen/teichoic acid export membrane protein
MIELRSVRSNISWSMISKIITMIVSFVSVPILLSLLGTDQYGNWATLTSMVAVISILDFGVGNSMRNSVSSINISGYETVQSEFISFFRLLIFIGLASSVLFVLFIPLFEISSNHLTAALFLYIPILLFLPLRLGHNVLQGIRANGLQSVLQVLGSWIFFIFIGVSYLTNFRPTLNALAIVWSLASLIVLFLVFNLAKKKLKLEVGSFFINPFSFSQKKRLRVGIEFFVLQLASLVLFSIGNLLVFNHLGSSEVARYDVLNKVFQVGLSFYNIIIGIMWSEISVFRSEGNVQALKRTFRRLALIAGGFSILCLLGALIVPLIIKLWTNGKILIQTKESLIVAGLVSVQSWAYVGAVFMNAFEKIVPQIILSLVSIIFMIPLAYTLMDYDFGIASVPLAAMILTIFAMIVCNFYAMKLIGDLEK